MAEPATDGPHDSTETDHRDDAGPAEVIDAYEALWNGDYAKVDVVAEGATVFDPAAPEGVLHGRAAVEAHIRETFRGFPDFAIEVEDVFPRGDAAMLAGRATGTFSGEFYGAPPTGRAMDVPWMARMAVADGQVQRDRIVYDQQAMYAQLGVTFPDVLFLLPRMVGAKLRGLR